MLSAERNHLLLLRPYHHLMLLLTLAVILFSSSSLVHVVQAEDPKNSKTAIATDNASLQKYLANHDMDSLHKALSKLFRESERMPLDKQREASTTTVTPLSPHKAQRGSGFDVTTRYKMKADLEQFQYLVDVVFKHQPEKQLFFKQKVIPVYEKVLQNMPSDEILAKDQGLYRFQLSDVLLGIKEYYNRALYRPEEDEDEAIAGDNSQSSCPTDILNPNLDWKAIEHEYWQQDPQVVVIDNVLSEEALRRIRNILLESTVFYQTKNPTLVGTYTGAYIDDGLHDRILLELAMELRRKLPSILDPHALRYMWAYKYDSKKTTTSQEGIKLHADMAAVNVNLWITPDEANLDPNSGGLVVYTVKPPDHWNIMEYNTNTDRVYEELLKPAGFRNITVPYKENRALIFDSALFHHGDKQHFKQGYPNRRINLTILYGDMKPSGGSSSSAS